VAAEAFADVRKAFVFPAQGGVEFLQQARQAGVEQLVVLSSLAAAMDHEQDKTSFSALHHVAIERSVQAKRHPGHHPYMPQPIVKMLLDCWRDTVETPDEVFPSVMQLTGRPARTLAEWAREHAGAFAPRG
jgi:hypothetical protein